METQPIPVVKDATILHTNPHQERQKNSLEGPSVSILVEERALHATDQGVKPRCTSRPPKTFTHLIECGYTSDEVRETLKPKVCSNKKMLFRSVKRISNCHRLTVRKTWKDMKLMFKCQTDRVIWYRV